MQRKKSIIHQIIFQLLSMWILAIVIFSISHDPSNISLKILFSTAFFKRFFFFFLFSFFEGCLRSAAEIRARWPYGFYDFTDRSFGVGVRRFMSRGVQQEQKKYGPKCAPSKCWPWNIVRNSTKRRNIHFYTDW